jgi:hypothetical protein
MHGGLHERSFGSQSSAEAWTMLSFMHERKHSITQAGRDRRVVSSMLAAVTLKDAIKHS